MRGRATFLLGLIVTAASLTGCGAPTATLSGAVTVDGQSVDNGVISCGSVDGVGQPATAQIQNGKYRLQTTPGEKWVQISAPAAAGQRKAYNSPDAPLVDITEERLPDRYNAKTELKLTLKAGDNVKDWALEGKPRQGKGK